jgi:hypothetical protein
MMNTRSASRIPDVRITRECQSNVRRLGIVSIAYYLLASCAHHWVLLVSWRTISKTILYCSKPLVHTCVEDQVDHSWCGISTQASVALTCSLGSLVCCLQASYIYRLRSRPVDTASSSIGDVPSRPGAPPITANPDILSASSPNQ